MERTAQCRCGSLRIVATGDPERVYLCTAEFFYAKKGSVAESARLDLGPVPARYVNLSIHTAPGVRNLVDTDPADLDPVTASSSGDPSA
jgi:hypothetical protein